MSIEYNTEYNTCTVPVLNWNTEMCQTYSNLYFQMEIYIGGKYEQLQCRSVTQSSQTSTSSSGLIRFSLGWTCTYLLYS